LTIGIVKTDFNMLEVNLSDMKAHFSDYLREVEAGASFLVTRHGKPVAVLRLPEEEEARRKRFSELMDYFKAHPIKVTTEEIRECIDEGRR